MDFQLVYAYFLKYGAVVIFVIVFLEYLNLPGFPAGVIMPLSGFWAARGNIGFITTLFLSVAAGLFGSWMLYFLGRFGGGFLLEKYMTRFPKQRPMIEKAMGYVQEKGYWGLMIGKLIPMFRTIISIPAGMLGMNFIGYTLSSAAGITIWNLVLIGAGYFFGERILPAVYR